MLRLLYWVLWPVAAIGIAASRLRNWADETDRKRRSLRPGATVSLRCTCHLYELWFVDYYAVDADDYHLVDRWPYDWRDRAAKTMYMKRDKFEPVAPGSATPADAVAEGVR